MHVPEGFKVESIATEPDLVQPVAFAFDDRGRIWVAEALGYPQKQPAGQGKDRILIFEDVDGDGKFESRKVFAENLNLVSGLEVGHGGVWVGAAPDLLFIPDRDGDDKPDSSPISLLQGFGFQDTHECLNSFLWGPDGWLYGNQGVFNYSRIGKPGAAESDKRELRAGVWRYHPVRNEFEVFADGGSNQWGLDYDEHGQIFMTHCRSYWGRGGTTHVIQGGHFWNQANANYPSFILANPPEDFPGLRNFLLASARYDHGAGGAGAPGSDAIYGGHSHVGTLIYQGDNWPAEFRGHLFTHNLHGHQINHQVNRRSGSGFETVHAGHDQLFCTDPKYVAIDLQQGPDGAVYMIDWYDQQHCHNPNTERWDRSNGRIYRMQFDSTYKPVKVNLRAKSDEELVSMMDHPNDWFSRMSRRLLHERAQSRELSPASVQMLQKELRSESNPVRRLKALWALHLASRLNEESLLGTMQDSDDFMRGWAVQLACESLKPSVRIQDQLIRMAKEDPSQTVRLYLSSAANRVPGSTAWTILENLSHHGEDSADRNLPLMIWQQLAPRMISDPARGWELISKSGMPQLADYASWFLAGAGGPGLDVSISRLSEVDGEALNRRLALILKALEARAGSSQPPSWATVSARLLGSRDSSTVMRAELIAAYFGDKSQLPKFRATLADQTGTRQSRMHAFEVLSRASDRESLGLFLRLLDDSEFRSRVMPLLSKFEDPSVADALISRLGSFSQGDRSLALQTLTSRSSHALRLMKSVSSGEIRREMVTAYHVRQLGLLRDPEISRLVSAHWGSVRQTATAKKEQMDRLEKVYNEAPLWAYDGREGLKHFQKLCISCHVMKGEGTRIGPDLTGAGANGVRYFLENIIDPNAVIGTDYQLTNIETLQGELVSGVVVQESASAVTVRFAGGESTVARSSIARRATSEVSLMPEGLLDALIPREQIELLKFLTSN